MRASPKVVGVGLTLAVIVSSFSPTTAAEPKDEVAAATAAWAQALGEDDPEKVLPLYSSDAVLWGTISQLRRCLVEYDDIPESLLQFLNANRR